MSYLLIVRRCELYGFSTIQNKYYFIMHPSPFALQRPQFGAHNDVHRNQWFNRDLEAMAEALNTEEVFIDADRSECS